MIDGGEEVAGVHGNVLHPWSAVELEVLVDLRALQTLGGFVDRKLDDPGPVPHHLRHESGVLGADGVIVEVLEECEAEHALVELDPVVHLPEFHVRHNVVDELEADRLRNRVFARLEAGNLALALDEGVNRVSVRLDCGAHRPTAGVFDDIGLCRGIRAALEGDLERSFGVGHQDGEVVHTGTMPVHMFADRVVGIHCPGDDEPDLPLLQEI